MNNELFGRMYMYLKNKPDIWVSEYTLLNKAVGAGFTERQFKECVVVLKETVDIGYMQGKFKWYEISPEMKGKMERQLAAFDELT